MSTMPPENPQNEASPNENSGKVNVSDVFGFGKAVDKLPLHKLTSRMSYCTLFCILLLSFIGGLAMFDKKLGTFPNEWDVRVIIVLCVIVFLFGLGDIFVKKGTVQTK